MVPFFVVQNERKVIRLTAAIQPRVITSLTSNVNPRRLVRIHGTIQPRTILTITGAAQAPRRYIRLVGVAERQVFRVLTLTGRVVAPTRIVRRLTGRIQSTGTKNIKNGTAENWVFTTHASTSGDNIKSWTYSRGENLTPSLQVTYHGDQRSLSEAGQLITVTATNSSTGQTLTFSTEPLVGTGACDYNEGQFETVINYTSEVQDRLGKVLPEFIPWADDPPKSRNPNESCRQRRAKRRTIGVASVLQQAIGHAGLSVEFCPPQYGNIFAGKIMEDSAADYSTKGKTVQQVLTDFYGRIGAVFASKGTKTLLVIHPSHVDDSSLVPDEILFRYCTNRTVSRVAGIDLGRVHLYGKATEEEFLEAFGIPDGPDFESLNFELQDAGILKSKQATEDGVIYNGIQKVGGQVVREGTIELGKVIAKAPEGSDEKDREFSRVPISQTNTYKFYSPTCEGALSVTYQEHKSFGYSFNTTLESVALSIPGYQFGTSGGQVLGVETTQVNHEYSAQGWLKRRITRTRKTGSLAVQNAGEDNEELLSGVVVTQTTEERWQPTGGGRWLYSRITMGDQLTPTTDEGGAWVGLEKKSGVIESISEETDGAPDTPTCECSEVVTPIEYEWVGSGAESVEESFPTEPSLEAIASSIRASRTPKRQQQWTLPLPVRVSLRRAAAGHWVTGISASGNGGADFSLTITAETEV